MKRIAVALFVLTAGLAARADELYEAIEFDLDEDGRPDFWRTQRLRDAR